MIRRALLLLAAVCGATPLFGVDKDGNLLIGIIGKSAANPVFAIVRQGAEQAAKDLGTQYNIKIRIVDRSPPKEDAHLQAAAIEKLVLEGADGITIACSDTSILTPTINDAVEAGVQVATYGSDAPASRRCFCYLADNDQCGQTLMVSLARLMNGKGVIGILGGNPQAENLHRRVLGIKSAAALYPGITIRGVFYSTDAPEDAAKRLQTAMHDNPDITGWAMVGSWPMSVAGAFPWKPGAVKCVGVGILPNQTACVKDGHVDLVIAQPYFQWGFRPVERLVYKISLSRNPPNPVEYAPIVTVTGANIAHYEKYTMGTWGK